MVIKKIDNFSNVSSVLDRSMNELYTWAIKPLTFKKTTKVSYTIPADTEYLEIDTSDNAITLTLPSVSDFNNRILKIKDVNGNANSKNITIVAAESGVVIDGVASLVIFVDYEKTVIYSNGSNWFILSGVETKLGRWQTWTPTLTQSGSINITIDEARYVKIGKTVIVHCKITATAAGTGNNTIIVGGLPVSITVGATKAVGAFAFLDAGLAWYIGSAQQVSTTTLEFQAHDLGNRLGKNPNFAVASGDVISFTISYEVP